MVFLIKQQSTFDIDIDIICKTMINIEQNKNVYDINGTTITSPLYSVPFNSYTHQLVDYEMTMSVGVLALYIPNSEETNITIIEMIKDKFRELGGIDRHTKIPIVSGNNKSTTYTLLNSIIPFDMENSIVPRGISYRKIILGDHNITNVCENGSRFVWIIQPINNS